MHSNGVNPNLYWGGGEIFSIIGRALARRAESGGGVLGEGAASPPPHQPRGLGNAVKLP